jgi:hypothetical protein
VRDKALKQVAFYIAQVKEVMQQSHVAHGTYLATADATAGCPEAVVHLDSWPERSFDGIARNPAICRLETQRPSVERLSLRPGRQATAGVAF